MAHPFHKPPSIWDEKIKFNDFFEVDHVSYNLWTEEVMKAFVGLKAGKNHRDAELLPVGTDKIFYWKELNGLAMYKHSPFGFFSTLSVERRVNLHTFWGGKEGSVYFDGVVKIPVLAKDSDPTKVWMSLTPMEVFSQRGGLRKARGTVLMGGLGLGWLARRVLERKKVKKLTVVEIDEAVARVFGDPLKEEFGDRLEIIVGDIYKDADAFNYDSFLCDIWKNAGGASSDKKFLRIAAQHPNAWAWGSEWQGDVEWMAAQMRDEKRIYSKESLHNNQLGASV